MCIRDRSVFDPKAMTWIIVGDLSKIEAGVRALDLGEVTVVDADGKPVAAKAAEVPTAEAAEPAATN